MSDEALPDEAFFLSSLTIQLSIRTRRRCSISQLIRDRRRPNVVVLLFGYKALRVAPL